MTGPRNGAPAPSRANRGRARVGENPDGERRVRSPSFLDGPGAVH